MTFLRTVSTRRLLALIAGVVVAVAGGTAIAVAAAGNGPVPPARSLAAAIHQALAAKAPDGISAQITFTNNLISSTDVSGDSDPLLTGASGRLWMTADRFRLELQSDNGDAQVIADRTSFWVYDPSSNTVYEGAWSAFRNRADRARRAATDAHPQQIPSLSTIQSDLSRLAAHLDLSGAQPTDVAGQAAYRVTVSPKHDGGLLGDAQLAWDASRGIPLDFAIYAHGDQTPVIELKATGISYGPIALSDLALAPPRGAKVVKVTGARVASARSARTRTRASSRPAEHVSGVSAVAAHLSFPLIAKAQLGGLPRRSVKLLDWGGSPAAVVLYGHGLGGIAVIERAAAAAAAAAAAGGAASPKTESNAGLNLPTVSIEGSTGQELDTELGSVLEFTRGGVSYALAGSVPAAAIESAARDL